MHTCAFSLSLSPCSQFCFVPKILILSFTEGAEVNKSTIKAFLEQNRSIILWVSRFQILISVLNSAFSPLERRRNGEKWKQMILPTRTWTSFCVLIAWANRHVLSGLWYIWVKLRSAQRWRLVAVHFLPLEKVPYLKNGTELFPACLSHSTSSTSPGGWGQPLYCPCLAPWWNDSLLAP